MSSLVTPGPSQLIGMDGRIIPVTANEVPVVFSEEDEAKREAFHRLGDLRDLELLFNDILVVKYIRLELSKNLKASHQTQKEDKYQNGIGLVLKMGPTAFQDDENNKFPDVCRTIKPGDWVMYRISDGWDRAVQELYGLHRFADCRMINDAHVRARVKYPARFASAGW